MAVAQGTISEIRSFNRFYTNILGLLNQDILDSSYSLTEVRVLLEIGHSEGCTANALIARLNVDKGYLSRIIKRFESDGLIRKENSARDGRTFLLHLTAKGQQLLTGLEAKSDNQVRSLIDHLPEEEQQKLIAAMQYITARLTPGLNPVRIRSFRPADLDYLIQRHRELYTVEYGFRPAFVDYVAATVHQFAAGYDETRENIWVAECNENPAGVIAVVQSDDHTAQLRWFLIEPAMRGRGIGHRLMKTALDFCRDAGYQHALLWTVSILGAARHLYQHYGFTVTETKENRVWSDTILMEERWDLDLWSASLPQACYVDAPGLTPFPGPAGDDRR